MTGGRDGGGRMTGHRDGGLTDGRRDGGRTDGWRDGGRTDGRRDGGSVRHVEQQTIFDWTLMIDGGEDESSSMAELTCLSCQSLIRDSINKSPELRDIDQSIDHFEFEAGQKQ